MKPQNSTTINLTVTTAFVPMSVDNTDDEYILTISPVDTTKPSYQHTYATSSS